MIDYIKLFHFMWFYLLDEEKVAIATNRKKQEEKGCSGVHRMIIAFTHRKYFLCVALMGRKRVFIFALIRTKGSGSMCKISRIYLTTLLRGGWIDFTQRMNLSIPMRILITG